MRAANVLLKLQWSFCALLAAWLSLRPVLLLLKCTYSLKNRSAAAQVCLAGRFCRGDGESLETLLAVELKPFLRNAENVAEEIGKRYYSHFCAETSANFYQQDDDIIEKPLVLALGGVKGSERHVQCLATRVAKFLNYHTDLSGFQNKAKGDKKMIDAVKQAASICKFPVFTAPILDLPIQRMYDFHVLCDETNAHEKRATYIFTVIRPEDKSYTEVVESAFDPDGKYHNVAPALQVRVFPELEFVFDLVFKGEVDPCRI